MTRSPNRTEAASDSPENFKCFWPLALMQQAQAAIVFESPAIKT